MSHLSDQLQTGSQTSVLLVEDDEDLRCSLADYLRLGDLAVTEAGSGLECYQAMRKGRFDIAILDINLPDTDGLILARDIAEDKRTGIIVLTARAGRDDRVRSFSEGADVFLTKPVCGEELMLAVDNLARRLGPAAPADEVSSWRLDMALRCLTAPDGRQAQLSGREALLMKGLADARGEVVPKSSLIRLLGYEGLAPESRSLDAVLRRLRRKVEDLPLLSIHSLGIVFSAPIELV